MGLLEILGKYTREREEAVRSIFNVGPGRRLDPQESSSSTNHSGLSVREEKQARLALLFLWGQAEERRDLNSTERERERERRALTGWLADWLAG